MRRKLKSPSHFSRKLSVLRLEERATPAITAVGNQFQVNTFTADPQGNPAVASDADGDSVVVWQSFGQDGANFGIYGKRYSSTGAVLGGEFLVNSYTTNTQVTPAVAMDALGSFVVVWDSNSQDGANGGIYAQRFNAAGIRLGPEFQVNQFTTGSQSNPSVAMDVDGDFVVAWNSTNQEGGGAAALGVYARRFGFDGVPRSSEFLVNTFTNGSQFDPDLAINARGDFVIVWQSIDQDASSESVHGQRYSAAGAALGGEFRVNTFTTGPQTDPSVGMDAAGNFTVAWQTQNQASATSGSDIFQRRFDAAGVPLGNDEIAATTFAGEQTAPDVGRSAVGQYVVGYVAQIGANVFVWGKAFDAAGVSLSGDLPLNSNSSAGFQTVALASDAEGDFVAAWGGEGTGDSNGVFARRFDESVDAASPWAVSLFPVGEPSPITDGERLVAPVASLVLTFSEAMATAGGGSVTAINNYILKRNGTNINAQITSVGFAFNATTRRHEATFTLSAPLDFGDYELALRSTIDDATGNGIDGNFDGAPGGNFSRNWRVATPAATGLEIPINGVTAGGQFAPAAASDAAGNFVVAWAENDASNFGIFARRFNALGAALGNNFPVNVFTTGVQQTPDVATDAAGNFVVVWDSADQDGGLQGVYGRRFSASGAPLGGEFRANTFTTASQSNAQIAMNAAGEFVVLWSSTGQDGSSVGIYGQRYSADGTTRGGEFRVNLFTTGIQAGPGVALDAAGNFVVAWQSAAQDGALNGVYARRFRADGPIDSAEIAVNTTTSGNQQIPSVAVSAAGDFIVAWESDSQDGSGFGVYARRFSANGTALGGEFRVNTTTTSDQRDAAIAADSDGDFVVTWLNEAAGNFDIFAQKYSAAGVAIGGEFRVNVTTTNNQLSPAVTAETDGDFVVLWSGNGPGDVGGVFAQRFADAAPPPQVALVQVNDGTAQRSRVTSLTVTFNTQVTITGAFAVSFILTRAGGGSVTLTGSSNVVGGVTVVTLNNFTGAETEFGSLRDGRYTLTVNSALISTSGGLLDGNGDGIGDDDFTFGDAQGLYRFYGDMNGDRRNDISDFGFFSAAYLQGPGANNPFLDFNQDGRIDISDFGQFSLRYFTNLP